MFVTEALGDLCVYKDCGDQPTLVDSATPVEVHGGTPVAIEAVHAAIDANDDIHVVAAAGFDGATRDVAYAICDLSSGFGTWEAAATYTDAAPDNQGVSISLDSNDKPFVLFVDAVKQTGSTVDNVYVIDKTGASWANLTQIGARATKTDTYDSPHITVRNSDYMEAWYYFRTDGDPAYKTNTGTWGSESVYTETSATVGAVLATTGGTVYRYHADDTEDIEESDADTTYNTDDTYAGVSATLDGTDRYVLYIDTSDDVHYIYNTGSGWTDGGAIEAGTYLRVIAEWAYNNENQSGEINYIFDDGTDVFYNSLSLAAEPFPPVPGRVHRDWRSPLLRM